MEYWMWSLLLKPLFILFYVFCILAPAVWLVKRFVPEGKLKDLLLYDTHKFWYASKPAGPDKRD